MKSTRLFLVVCVGVCFGCASGQKPADEPVMTPASSDAPTPQTQYGCATEDGEPLQCTTNEDCCEGYSCSIDPDRSRITRYCL
jgi:hypothetical protein